MKYLIEHLPRIETVTLIVESEQVYGVKNLRTYSVEIVDVNGSPCTINLPHRIQINSGRIGLQMSDGGCQTLRLKASKEAELNNVYKDRSVNRPMLASPQMWMRKDLMEKKEFEIQCAHCHYPLISNQDCGKLSDLPSEFWVELMDYWHCHKPIINDNVSVDRYARLHPRDDELLVGSSLFRVKSTWPTARLIFNGTHTRCARCQYELGRVSEDPALYNINKWSVQLAKGELLESYPPELHIISSLLNSLNSSGTRIVNLKSSSSEEQLLIWIFVVGVNITLRDNEILENCIKIYYKTGKEPLSQSQDQNVDQLSVDGPVLTHLIEKLESINADLPAAVKVMHCWKLGYLTTF
ncbi:LAME_0E13432g1_1 [Lachancea meyersii CBS 8951]|uniref:LAME_0E13432g1_1 n=1 Tax=Lachancea meyersii CBS 8951 TaxID=1266667 RepID=A0A1G4JMG2_9SACH|nr:LAME_0E13432g1_1 [Lachancea meyersii CBS 8951]